MSQIRAIIEPDDLVLQCKLALLTEDVASRLYQLIIKIKTLPNMTKLLRLIYGDVYYGTRLVKFGMSDNDRCI
jgi:hypothetical protein